MDNSIYYKTGLSDGIDAVACGSKLHKIHSVSVTIPHIFDFIDIKFDTNLQYTGCYSHSWGISNFKLYIDPCSEDCKSCAKGLPDYCYSCAEPNTEKEDGFCKKIVHCESDEWNNDRVCEKCNKACETCEGSSASLEGGGCLECKEGYKKNEAGECDKCEGYLESERCKPCQEACKTCDGPTHFLNSGWGCIECNDGFYESININCEKCDKNCKTCEGQASKCTSCSES